MLTINKADAVVTANSGTGVYTGLAQSVDGFTVSGLVNDETADVLTGVTVSGSGQNAGTYSVVASGTDSNYNLTLNSGSLTIDKAQLTVTADAASRTYGGSNPALTTSLSGFVNNENAGTAGLTGTGSATTTAVATTNAGTAVITAGAGTLSASNYDFSTLADGVLTINPSSVELAAGDMLTMTGRIAGPVGISSGVRPVVDPRNSLSLRTQLAIVENGGINLPEHGGTNPPENRPLYAQE